MEKLSELKLALLLIVIGIPGWYFGSMLEKSGSGPTTPTMGLISIVLGVIVLVWVGYKNISPSKPAEAEPANPAPPRLGLSPREMKSLKLGALGAVIVALSTNFFPIWHFGPDKFWLFAGVYCGAVIAGFVFFYLAGYYYFTEEP